MEDGMSDGGRWMALVGQRVTASVEERSLPSVASPLGKRPHNLCRPLATTRLRVERYKVLYSRRPNSLRLATRCYRESDPPPLLQ